MSAEQQQQQIHAQLQQSSPYRDYCYSEERQEVEEEEEEENSSRSIDDDDNNNTNKNNNNIIISGNKRIRRRPVSFGNPALGTYSGSIYTLERQEHQVNNHHYQNNNYHTPPTTNDNNEPAIIIEGAETVEKIVVMVDVPPEQVPEGILNLVRSYQPYIHHIRIVIEEKETKQNNIEEEDDDDENDTVVVTSTGDNSATSQPTTTTTAAATAAAVAATIKEEVVMETVAPIADNLINNTATTPNTNQQQITDNITDRITKSMIEQLLEEDEEDHDGVQDNGNNYQMQLPTTTAQFIDSLSASTVENAASIIAADGFNDTGESDKVKETKAQGTKTISSAATNGRKKMLKSSSSISNSSSIGRSNNTNNYDSEAGDNIHHRPSRTYLIIFEVSSDDSAHMLVEDLHGKPYTSLDETQICSMKHAVALSGENGVSLLSPFFAPCATKIATAVKSKTTTTTPTSSHQPQHKQEQQQQQQNSCNKNDYDNNKVHDIVASASSGSAASSTTSASNNNNAEEHYNCAVCLEHMNFDYNSKDGEIRFSILTTVCNHTFHMDCLLRWQDSPCPVCRYDHSGLNEALSRCNICGTTENNFVCLICGVISCSGGRRRSRGGGSESCIDTGELIVNNQSSITRATIASNDNASTNNNDIIIENLQEQQRESATSPILASHARKHYDETLHAYALDTETQHVWDFAGQGYVHRLLQNKEDGKLVEYNDPNNNFLTSASPLERSLSSGLSDIQEGEVVHRKLEGFANQYYTLLKSQLEQQRTYYESKLEELKRECDRKNKKSTTDYITALKQEKNTLSKRNIVLQNKYKKISDDVVFLKSMNESLEANKKVLKNKIQETTQKQRIDSKTRLVQQRIPLLQSQLTELMLQLETGIISTTPSTTTTTATATNEEDDDDDDRNKKPAARTTGNATGRHKRKT